MADKLDTTYRIRTRVGEDAPDVVNVNINQHYDFFDILSLHINQKNTYNMPLSGYGIVCGRVQANGGFGIENAKVSIFIPYNSMEYDPQDLALYSYRDPNSSDRSTGVRYNLLPSFVDRACHQDIGTMYSKDVLLDNNDIITVFEKYYRYTTRTNKAGDYMIPCIPVGDYVLHTDVDLSDIGALSQKPIDMIYKGYNINQFENLSKFKKDSNLESLAQVKTQNKSIHIYPYWGDTTVTTESISITRCDVDLDYRFEPTCVFMGSIVTDSGTTSIGKTCVPSKETGVMSNLTTGSGTIEMIRKTFNGKVEEFSIQGKQLIDDNGTWCYQIPMNLDYVVTNEFGETVPTDDPSKGIPTRSRVRFRIGIDGSILGDSAIKTAKFLIPNNPRVDEEHPKFSRSYQPDYEFGTFTKDESFKDLYWNKVYTVKSYIPRLQKSTDPHAEKHTGIKRISFHGANNPMPYNNIAINFNFIYRFVCALLKMLMYIVGAINFALTTTASFLFVPLIELLDALSKWFGTDQWTCSLKKAYTSMHISMTSFCDAENSNKEYMPGAIGDYVSRCNGYAEDCPEIPNMAYESDMGELLTCIESTLAEENEIVSYNFQNDWVNGVLYAPQWYRRIRKKKRYFFNLIEIPERDVWCSAETDSRHGGSFFYRQMNLYQNCAIQREKASKFRLAPIPYVQQQENANLFGLNQQLKNWGMQFGYINKGENSGYGARAHNRNLSYIKVDKGIIMKKPTKLAKLYDKDDYVYYYRPVEYDPNLNKRWNGRNPVTDTTTTGDVKLLYATDLVLLGSLSDCDSDGMSQFFKYLPTTTYNMPTNLIDMNYVVKDMSTNAEGEYEEKVDPSSVTAEIDGANWGFRSWEQTSDANRQPHTLAEVDLNGDAINPDGGLFFGLSCQFSYVIAKSIINMARICEYGVSLDQSVENAYFDGDGFSQTSKPIPPDGFVSYDEIEDMDGRSMFASMNVNGLRTKRDERTGYPVYDIRYCYPANFDGSLSAIMKSTNSRRPRYKNNDMLELNSDDYVRFRYGNEGAKFYRDGSENVGWQSGGKTKYNLDRFPIYENSFYFYFGLRPGQTAMDRFRRDFYSDCENDAAEEASIVSEYVPNSWCSETGTDIQPDGYIQFTINGIEMPYDIKVNDKNGDLCYREFNSVENVNSRFYTLYNEGMGSEYTKTADGNLYITGMGTDNIRFGGLFSGTDALEVTDSDGYKVYLANGMYEFTFTDANGEMSSMSLTFTGWNLAYERDVQNFTISNEELLEAPYNGKYSVIANATDNPIDGRRQIGGFISLGGIHRGDDAADNNVRCKVSIIPQDDTWYSTDPSAENYYYPPVLMYRNGMFELEDPNMHGLIYNEDGTVIIGLPKGNENYVLTMVEYCGKEASRNETTEVFMLGDAIDYRMIVNGVDYRLIQNFDTAWRCADSPYTYDVMEPVGTLKGWTDIWNIGGVTEIPMVVKPYDARGYVGEQIAKLNNNLTGSAYTWTEEYTYPIDNFTERIPIVTMDQINGEYTYVRMEGRATERYTIYVRISGNNYAALPENPPLDYETYFNNLSESEKFEIISEINEVIAKRKAVAQAMQDGFWMMDKEESKTLEITYECGNTPVKYLVRYDSDYVYYTLDGMYDTNVIYGITDPTITTGFNGGIDFPIKPYYMAIANSVKNTIPNALGYDTPHGFMDTYPDQRKMFGVHYVAKYVDTHSLRSWNRHNNIPYFGGLEYNESNITFTGTDPTIGRYISVDGMLCGYMFNGITNPDRTDDDNVCEVQNVGDIHIKMHEYDAGALKYPTKRMVYNTDGVYDGLVLDNTLATDIPQQCAALTSGMDTLTLQQGEWTYTHALTTEDSITVDPTSTVVSWIKSGNTYTTHYSVTFNLTAGGSVDIWHGVAYATPIYYMYDGAISGGNYGMYNNSLTFSYRGSTARNENNSVHIIGTCLPAANSALEVVAVREDGVGLISSPAYDIKPMYWLTLPSNKVFIVLGTDEAHLNHWYLRNYEFDITDKVSGSTQFVSVRTTLDTTTYNGVTYYGMEETLIADYSGGGIYIIDVLGMRYSPIQLN